VYARLVHSMAQGLLGELACTFSRVSATEMMRVGS